MTLHTELELKNSGCHRGQRGFTVTSGPAAALHPMPKQAASLGLAHCGTTAAEVSSLTIVYIHEACLQQLLH